MGIFKKPRKSTGGVLAVQLGRRNGSANLFGHSTFASAESELYDAMRSSIPIIDAAICKTVRLIGGFTADCGDEGITKRLGEFLNEVKVGPSSYGITAFLTSYLDQLLTYGTAVGEIVPNSDGEGVGALYVANIKTLEFEQGDNPLQIGIYVNDMFGERRLVKNPDLILLTALNPTAGEVRGKSVLSSLPFVSSVLLKIFNTIGNNWERIGNIRFAVTGKSGEGDAYSSADERARMIADAWQSAMCDGSEVKDFVAVGDVDIKVIGADNPIPDSSVPVRQLLEQIVAKLGIPPFMLGLSWSSTERMSTQQADILTSELEYYRSIVTPVIKKICRTWLGQNGCSTYVDILWDNINLQDEVELAKAELYRAQALQIESNT